MQTVFLGGISLYNYDPSSQAITPDPNIPFINTITDLAQSAGGSFQEYVMPNQLPALLGAEAQFMPSSVVPAFSNGVIKLSALHHATTVGFMYGGILAQEANNGPSTGSGEIFKVTVVPTKPRA